MTEKPSFTKSNARFIIYPVDGPVKLSSVNMFYCPWWGGSRVKTNPGVECKGPSRPLPDSWHRHHLQDEHKPCTNRWLLKTRL